MVTLCALVCGVAGDCASAATMLGLVPLCLLALAATTAARQPRNAELCRTWQRVEEVSLSLQGCGLGCGWSSKSLHQMPIMMLNRQANSA